MMRILLIHNKYQQRGGEDLVFESEESLLKNYGNEVDKLIFDNGKIKTGLDKLFTALSSIYNFTSGKILKDKIEDFKPDIIHVHNFFPLASPSIFFVAKRHRIPIVMTLHNYRLICPSATLFFNNKIYEDSIYKKFPLSAIRKSVYRNSKIETAMVVSTTGIHKLLHTWNKKVNGYIALTQFAKNKFLSSSLQVDAAKIFVKPNFVEDLGYNLKERKAYILFVGRLSPEKGITQLLAAAEQVPEINFKIIGDGPLKDIVIKKSNFCANIEYLGFQNKAFIIDQLKQARALIFPSLWYEGFPMTILEAFSCGTPVIASALGSQKEIINHEINGLLFNHTHLPDLIEKIKRIAEDDTLHSILCKNTRSEYEAHYTPEKNYSRLIDIYKKAAELN